MNRKTFTYILVIQSFFLAALRAIIEIYAFSVHYSERVAVFLETLMVVDIYVFIGILLTGVVVLLKCKKERLSAEIVKTVIAVAISLAVNVWAYPVGITYSSQTLYSDVSIRVVHTYDEGNRTLQLCRVLDSKTGTDLYAYNISGKALAEYANCRKVHIETHEKDGKSITYIDDFAGDSGRLEKKT